MAEKKAIHEFAVKYHSLYVNPQTTEREVEEGFADQCFAFNFEMDCGNRFIDTFSSDAFYKNDALDKTHCSEPDHGAMLAFWIQVPGHFIGERMIIMKRIEVDPQIFQML